MPVVITPSSRESSFSRRWFHAQVSDHSTKSRWRSSSARHCRRALAGSRIHEAGVGDLDTGFSPSGAPTRTTARLCARRVTMRTSTGTRKRSERSNASRVMS